MMARCEAFFLSSIAFKIPWQLLTAGKVKWIYRDALMRFQQHLSQWGKQLWAQQWINFLCFRSLALVQSANNARTQQIVQVHNTCSLSYLLLHAEHVVNFLASTIEGIFFFSGSSFRKDKRICKQSLTGGIWYAKGSWWMVLTWPGASQHTNRRDPRETIFSSQEERWKEPRWAERIACSQIKQSKIHRTHGISTSSLRLLYARVRSALSA